MMPKKALQNSQTVHIIWFISFFWEIGGNSRLFQKFPVSREIAKFPGKSNPNITFQYSIVESLSYSRYDLDEILRLFPNILLAQLRIP